MLRLSTMCAVTGLMIAGVALGQATGSPFASEVQGNYARIKANIIKAAEKMPPENYSYKPTPDIRTYARVVNHVTEAQFHICGASNNNADTPKVPGETADKAAILDALNASFAECDKAYGALTDANLTEMFSVGPAKRSRID